MPSKPESPSQTMGADLILPGQTTKRVTVRDLERHGVQLVRTSLPLGTRNGVKVQIGLRIPPHSLDGYRRVAAIITLPDQHHAEASFIDPTPEFITAVNEYLESQNTERNLAEAEKRRFATRMQCIDALSKDAVEDLTVKMITELLDTIVTGLIEQGERAGNNIERGRVLDDANCLRCAHIQDGLQLRLAEELIKLHVDAGSTSVLTPTLLDDNSTTSAIAAKKLIEQLDRQLAIPLRQLTCRLQELKVEMVYPPCSPMIIAKTLERAFIDLGLSVEGCVYGLRCAMKLAPQLAKLYMAVMIAWESLATPE